MPSKIVVCLRGTTPKEILTSFQRQERISQVDVVEIRMDYLDPVYYTREFLQMFQEEISKPLIFTCRSKEQGGTHSISQDLRLELYFSAVKLNYDYVDIEIIDSNEFTKLFGGFQSSTKVILSFHNFNQTNLDDIRDKFEEMSSISHDFIKIVTFVNNDKEESNMDVIQNEILGEHPTVTIFGMGQHGKSSRIKGFLRSNYFTYLSSSIGKKTAVGQFSINEFNDLLKEM
jgi:3-dehydroquinate dehydratase type I